jgi:hypothetical protein
MSEKITINKNFEHSDGGKEILPILQKLQKIEKKEKCLRVKFLDWLSDKLLDWSNRVHMMASRIESPCLIEITPRKKEESASAIQSKEIARLKELLEIERNKNK